MHISPIGPSGTINLETKFESLPPVDQKTNAIATRLINSMDPTAPPIKKQNFLLQINQLVAEIMQLVSRLSDRERIKTDLLKQEYNDYNTVVSNAIISSGNWNFMTNMAGLSLRIGSTVAFGGKYIPKSIYKAFDAFGQTFPSLGQYMATGPEATRSKASSTMSLLTSELQSSSSKGGENSTWENQLIQALAEIKEWLRASARSNG